MLGLTRRRLETGSKCRASLRPYLGGTGGEIPPVYPTSKVEQIKKAESLLTLIILLGIVQTKSDTALEKVRVTGFDGR
jgi:hypothetical protein